jgi:DnaK suppressor protein
MPKSKKRNEFEHLRDILLRRREELNRRIEEHRKEVIAELEPDDEVGMALRNSSTGMAALSIEREVRNLTEIDLSLRRMDTGEYGICGLCGEKIPMVRLKAIPWTRSCVDCAGGSARRRPGAPGVPLQPLSPRF